MEAKLGEIRYHGKELKRWDADAYLDGRKTIIGGKVIYDGADPVEASKGIYKENYTNEEIETLDKLYSDNWRFIWDEVIRLHKERY